MARVKAVLPWFLGGVTALIVAVGGYEAYQGVTSLQHRAQTDAYLKVSEASSMQPLLDYAKEKGGTHGAMATLTAFARMSPAEQEKDGLPLLREAAINKDLPQDWRSLVALVLVKAEIAFGAGTDKADEMLALLKPAADDQANPWHALSALQSALIAGELKNDAKAAAAYVDMDTSNISRELAARITTLQARYGEAEAK